MAKPENPLHMMIADDADITVISSLFQDAVSKVGDMAWLPGQRRFALVANRFVWEEGVNKRFGPFTRVRSGFHFDDVLGVKTKNLRQDAPQSIIALLSIQFEASQDGMGQVIINLAGGGGILLDVETINGEMRDISAPWRTTRKPDHKLR